MRITYRPPGPSLFQYAGVPEVVAARPYLPPGRTGTASVGGAVLGHFGKPRRSGQPWNLNRQRLAEIEQLTLFRHDGPCTTDDGRSYVEGAHPHILRYPIEPAVPGQLPTVIQQRRSSVILWAQHWTPKLLQDEVERAWLVEREGMSKEECPPLKADAIGRLLCVTKAEREALDLRTIGATDFDKRQRDEARRQDSIARKAEARKKAGATPRAQSKSATKPWEALGLSRASYYRREKVAAAGLETVSGTIDEVSSLVCPHPSQPPVRALQLVEHSGTETPSGRASEWAAMLTSYTGGIVPEPLRRAFTEAKRARNVTQEQAAEEIGISRPQLANALRGRFGLSPETAARFKLWIGTGWQAPPWFASRAA